MLLPEGQAENGMSPDVPSQMGPGMEPRSPSSRPEVWWSSAHGVIMEGLSPDRLGLEF